jgi:hypothetical protein
VNGMREGTKVNLVKVGSRSVSMSLKFRVSAIPVHLLSLYSIWVIGVWGSIMVQKCWGRCDGGINCEV